MAENPGFKAGIDKSSKVKRIAWAWKGAKQNAKERRLNAMQAVTEARKLTEDCSVKVAKAGGQPRDVTVLLVFAESGDWGKRADVVVFGAVDPHGDSSDLEAVARNLRNVAVGFVVCVLDRRSGVYITSVRPLILDQSALTLVDAIAEKATDLSNWRTS